MYWTKLVFLYYCRLLMRVGHASNWMKSQDGLGGLCGFNSMRQASQWIVIPLFFFVYREHYSPSILTILKRAALQFSFASGFVFVCTCGSRENLSVDAVFPKKKFNENQRFLFIILFFLSLKEFVSARPARHSHSKIGYFVPMNWLIKEKADQHFFSHNLAIELILFLK